MKGKVYRSEVLDPDFCEGLIKTAALYDEAQQSADDFAWSIAADVNDQWDEHRSQFKTKDEYYAECSRVANGGLKRKRFCDSGETMRRWCEVHETYSAFEHAERFLNILSFDHLYRARKLYNKGKVISPLAALTEAAKMEYTAREMEYHFDPPTPPNLWEAMTGRIDAMLSREAWAWLNDRAKIDACIHHAKEIERIIKNDR